MATRADDSYPWDVSSTRGWTCEKMMVDARNALDEARDKVTGDFIDPTDKLIAASVYATLAVACAIRER